MGYITVQHIKSNCSVSHSGKLPIHVSKFNHSSVDHEKLPQGASSNTKCSACYWVSSQSLHNKGIQKLY